MDLALLFPPQWSPFQPPLSIASLSAWLRRAGYRISSHDLNLACYEWLFGESAAGILAESLSANRDIEQDRRESLAAVLAARRDFVADLESLRDKTGAPSGEELLARIYRGTQSVKTYLAAICELLGGTQLSLYQFSLPDFSISGLSDFALSPPRLLGKFAEEAVEELLPIHPSAWGISCIGQEQLPFTLLIGRMLKEKSPAPVIVGGTILSRLYERGHLPEIWFGRYFDGIVRHEGERPAEQILQNLKSGAPWFLDVSGLVYKRADSMVESPPPQALQAQEVPVPDFSDLPLPSYLSPEITLPLLAARGCYWGKCEFCHHGMVYGDGYSTASGEAVQAVVSALADRYKVRSFSFNDEAIPPKVAAAMATCFPSHAETGWVFTTLLKFEKYFKPEIFQGLQRIGFRSLYVGLESASERVLALMRKNTKREVMMANLRDGTAAGIWFHVFLFFGFPGETESEARETYEFILANSDIIASFGCGTFSLEHNAPIFRHLKDFGLRLVSNEAGDASVYYDYEVESGLGAGEAQKWQDRLESAALRIPKYRCASWISREHLLCLLRFYSPEGLAAACQGIAEARGIPRGSRVSQVLSVIKSSEGDAVVQRLAFAVIRVRGNLREAIQMAREHDAPVHLLLEPDITGKMLGCGQGAV